MAVIERVFEIDEEIAEQLDEFINPDEQTAYLNQFFLSLIEKKNRAMIDEIIWKSNQNLPNLNHQSSTDLLREMRNANYNI